MYLSNSSDTFGDPVFTHDSSYDYLSSKNHIVKLYLPNILTRFIKIDRDASILTICELKLYEGGKSIKLIMSSHYTHPGYLGSFQKDKLF